MQCGTTLLHAGAREADRFRHLFLAATGGMVQKGNPKHIMGPADICGVRATAGLGTVEEAQFRQLSDKCAKDGKKPVEIVTFPDIPAGARLVMNDRADLLLINLGFVNQMVADNPDKLERSFMIKTDWKVGVGLGRATRCWSKRWPTAWPRSAPTGRKRKSTTSINSTTLSRCRSKR